MCCSRGTAAMSPSCAPSTSALVTSRERRAVEECERRDVKGLYKKAREGLIPHFTGVSPDAPFEIPERPEIVVDTARSSLGGCTQTVIDYLETEGILEEGGFL